MKPILRIKPIDPPGRELEIELGADPATPTGGAGGWAKIARPRRKSLTEWQGVEGYEMPIPVIFDRFRENRSVEGQITRLERMAKKREGEAQPPIVRIRGPVPHTNLEWVIQDIEWGAMERRARDGQRTRQFATIVLWQYIAADLVLERKKSPAKDSRDRNRDRGKGDGKGQSRRTYTVRRGDTLSSIAARELGSASKWSKIADLNNIRDPKNLRVGQVLRLP